MNNNQPSSLSEVLTGAAILISAQLAAASTASCVKALPTETPSVLRGLWRQTLTSFFFTILAAVMWFRSSRRRDAEKKGACLDDEERNLLPKANGNNGEENTNNSLSSYARVTLVALSVMGATLLNDTIIIALGFASPAVVMCLCNTSEY